jgi:hypothetical protein
MASAIGMERALASAQKSPPGQAIMSVSRRILARETGMARRLPQGWQLPGRTQGNSRFCSCVTRNSPALKTLPDRRPCRVVRPIGIAGCEAQALERQGDGAQVGFLCGLTFCFSQRWYSAWFFGCQLIRYLSQ